MRVTQVRDFRGGTLTYDSHNGTDFAVPVGTEVLAAAPGRVFRVSNEFHRGGLKVFIDHGAGLITTSNHLARSLVRPGDVVRVGLKGQETPAGFYVPEDAIQFDGSAHHVAVAQDADDGSQTVAFVAVTPGETVGSLRRIQGELQPGVKVIVEGAHYVNRGDAVRTVEQLAVKP